MKPKLFCFPYAGGTSAIFKDWHKLLLDYDIIALDYPGHGRRFHESLVKTFDDLVMLMYEEIKPQLSGNDYFFGHSLGATVAYEVAYKIDVPKINKLIVSGSNAPQFSPHEEPVSHLHRNDFFKKIQQRYNGFSQEIIQEEELMQIILPIVQADFKLSEEYHFKNRRKLNTPILAIAGREDGYVYKDELEGWGALTAAPFKRVYISGDHFSLFKEPRELIQVLQAYLVGKVK